MSARKTAWHGPVTDKLSVDDIAKLFKLDQWNDFEERNMDYIFESSSYAGEDEAAREKSEMEAQTELYRKWHDAVMSAADNLFSEHHLALSPIKTSKQSIRPYEYKISPTKSWDVSLRDIIETINGVGMFHFSSPKEFLQSGPYASARVGVLTHLHHIAS